MSFRTPTLTLPTMAETGPRCGPGLSKVLRNKGWPSIRASVRSWYRDQCAICGRTHLLACHEKWQFDYGAGTKSLRDLWTVCGFCHRILHGAGSYMVGAMARHRGGSPEFIKTVETSFARVRRLALAASRGSSDTLQELMAMEYYLISCHFLDVTGTSAANYVAMCVDVLRKGEEHARVVWRADLGDLPAILEHYGVKERHRASLEARLEEVTKACCGYESPFLIAAEASGKPFDWGSCPKPGEEFLPDASD